MPSARSEAEKQRRYQRCMSRRSPSAGGTLCREGYCSAEARYEVHPSAYSNSHAARVCSGNLRAADGTTVRRASPRSPARARGLTRWHREKWVNACEPGHPPCGRARGSSPARADARYPYCRPTVRVSPKTPTLLSELTAAEVARRCAAKRASPRTRVRARPPPAPPFRWMPYAQAAAHEAEAAARGVSAVARARGGFMRVYEAARSAGAMRHRPVGGITWGAKRDNFIKRHMAQYVVRPTRRRWLALVMWAYRPPGPPPPPLA